MENDYGIAFLFFIGIGYFIYRVLSNESKYYEKKRKARKSGLYFTTGEILIGILVFIFMIAGIANR